MTWLFKNIIVVNEMLSYQKTGKKLGSRSDTLELLSSEWTIDKEELCRRSMIETDPVCTAVFLIRYYRVLYGTDYIVQMGSPSLLNNVPELVHYTVALSYRYILITPKEYEGDSSKTLAIFSVEGPIDRSDTVLRALSKLSPTYSIAVLCNSENSIRYWTKHKPSVLKDCTITIVQECTEELRAASALYYKMMVCNCRLCTDVSMRDKILKRYNVHILLMQKNGPILWNTETDYVHDSIKNIVK